MRTSYDIPIAACGFTICRVITERQNNLSFDVGGVVEFYPSKRMTLRFDAGDTVVRRDRENGVFAVVEKDLRLSKPSPETTHSLQRRAGVGFRF